MWEGLRKPKALSVIVVTVVASGCPVQAMVQAFGVEERPVASWRARAGKHGQQVPQALVHRGQLDLVQVQADEMRVSGHKMLAGMGLALLGSTRLWLGGVVSLTRDRRLADRWLAQGRACCQPVRARLGATAGWNASPGSLRRAFREKVKERAGCGSACLRVWQELCSATVIKRTQKKRGVQVTRQMPLGTLSLAQKLLAQSQGGRMLNTACLERVNGTMRERLASLTRQCRQAARRLEALETGMYLLGCTYNWCGPQHELSRRAAATQGVRAEVPLTPALASGLTDHVWSLWELLSYRVAPLPWVEPKRRRPSKQARSEVPSDPSRLRPLLRLRKGVLCSTTS